MKMNGGRIPVLPFKKNKKFHLAIRIEFKSIQKEIKSKVIISNKINGKSKEYTAVWDTGATHTGISHKIFDELELIPIDKSIIRGVNSILESDIALIDMEFLENLKIKDVRAGVCQLHDCDVLIGMDVIQKGDIAISHTGNKTLFSFAIPPFYNPTDLYEKAKQVNKNNKIKVKK